MNISNLSNLTDTESERINYKQTLDYELKNDELILKENIIINNKIHLDKQKIIDRINTLNNKRCNIKIFKIIYLNKINYSSNDNGVFFNINNLDDTQLLNIHNILSYYEKKKILENSNDEYTLSTDYTISNFDN